MSGDATIRAALDDVAGPEPVFGHPAGSDRETERVARDDRAEVAARAERPTSGVKAAADLGKLSRDSRNGARHRSLRRLQRRWDRWLQIEGVHHEAIGDVAT